MRIDDFEGKYAHGFSIALDPVLCRAGVNESSAVGFRIVSDTLLFYRMVQAHFRQLRFWACMGARQEMRHLTFVKAIPTKAPPFPTAKDTPPRSSESEAGPPVLAAVNKK
jgi:hypothetical protein